MFTLSTTFTTDEPVVAAEITEFTKVLVKNALLPAPLGAEGDSSDTGPPSPPGEEVQEVTGSRPFKTNDLELPDGELLWHKYKGVDLYAKVVDGWIMVGDARFDSLSLAADAAGKSVDPACHKPNGYRWWAVKRNGKWVTLETIRRK